MYSHLLFSWSFLDATPGVGCEFARSYDSLKTRFNGLLGEVRVFVAVVGEFFARLADRSDSFTLGGNGFASGDGPCVGVPKKPTRFGPSLDGDAGVNGEGDSDDFGD